MSERKGRKSGTVENSADALELVRWFSKAVLEFDQDQFGQPYHVEVELTVRDLNVTNQEQVSDS